MTVIPSTTAFDTAEIRTLREDIKAGSRAFTELRRAHDLREQTQCARYDVLLAAQRPTYPSAQHREGIAQVAAMIHDGIGYGDHHGFAPIADKAAGRCLPPTVHYEHRGQRMNIYAGAPYAARSIARLWSFDNDEIDALRTIIDDHGLRVISEWLHDDGIAFVLTSRKL